MMRSVQTAPDGHYNAIALYNQSIKFLRSYELSQAGMNVPKVSNAGSGMNVA